MGIDWNDYAIILARSIISYILIGIYTNSEFLNVTKNINVSGNLLAR